MAKQDVNTGVEILLSTYNGGAYLKDLLESILSQSFGDWRLTVRDDGSTDDTVSILKSYARAHPGRITLVNGSRKRLGPCQSFAQLLTRSKAGYIMFCDQDDVWLPEKIELTLRAMKGLEERYEGFPLLVHTDMKVVDRELNVIAGSFWKYQHINPNLKGFNNLLVFNNVTGCTMMMNGKLRDLALPVPKAAILHDWWIAIIASAFGRTEYIKTPTILYRQHGKNEAGAVKYSINYFASRLKDLDRSAGLLKKIVAQSKAFVAKYHGMLSEDKLETASNFAGLLEKDRSARVKTLLKFKLKGHGTLRNLGIFSLWLFLGQQNKKKNAQ